MKKFLCFIGWHDYTEWEVLFYEIDYRIHAVRQCKECGKRHVEHL